MSICLAGSKDGASLVYYLRIESLRVNSCESPSPVENLRTNLEVSRAQ